MEKPSLDRESLFFSQACRLERGIQFVAEFQAAWEILSKRKPDPTYAVDELGDVVEPSSRITRRI
jgi:hypothetical protein